MTELCSLALKFSIYDSNC